MKHNIIMIEAYYVYIIILCFNHTLFWMIKYTRSPLHVCLAWAGLTLHLLSNNCDNNTLPYLTTSTSSLRLHIVVTMDQLLGNPLCLPLHNLCGKFSRAPS